MTKPKLKLGFAGLGQAVQRIFVHDREIFDQPYTIVAAADTRADARETFRREFNDEVYESIEKLCASPNVDVVYVATPAEMHREHVVMAAEHGKHVVVDKPMALDLDDCAAMIDAADRNGVRLLAGHTHGFDTPVRKIAEIVRSGELGALVAINSWNYNEFNPRPWPTRELLSTHGPLLNQGPHHVDVVRVIGGGMIRSVRARTIWDSLRRCIGGYTAYLEFEDGAPATIHYDARGFFDVAELYDWVGEGGDRRDPEQNVRVRRHFRELRSLGDEELERTLEAQKDQGRYGASGLDPKTLSMWGYGAQQHAPQRHKFFGLTVVAFDRGALRQSPDGLLVYDDDGKREVALDQEVRGRAAELKELYESIVDDRPLLHDGRWGMATLEVCLAILRSGQERREILMQHQVSSLRSD
jgi:predicted dehydrogenase